MKHRSNAKNTGKKLEKLLDGVHMEYKLRRIADLEKVDPPVRVLGGGVKRRVIFKANPFLDYMGTITESGRLLMIEAKSTEKPTLSAGGNSGITGKQFAAMRRWQAAGALTGVVWYCFEKGAARLLTVADIAITLEHRKSVTWETAIELPGPDNGALHPFDYIPTLIQLDDNLKRNETDA